MQLFACRVRACERSLSQKSRGVFLAFVCFYDFCRFRRAGMSHRVYPYSLSGGISIDWLPGVPLAAWGGPGRTQGAVRAAPKTRNYTHTRVKGCASLARKCTTRGDEGILPELVGVTTSSVNRFIKIAS